MKIGLTFFCRAGARSIWSNGAEQQIIYLWRMLRLVPGVERVFLINGGDGPNEPHAGMMLDGLGVEFVKFEDVADEVDVLIEAGAQISPEHASRVRARGGRVVGYRFGNAFFIDAERTIHGRPAGAIFNGTVFDEIWTTPQHARSCASYWETCYRCPVRVLPHVWEPLFLEAAIREFKDGLSFGYVPGRAKKRIAIFEPNIGIVKTCHVPMLVVENAYRRSPESIGDVYVTNAIELKKHLTFQRFAANLDVVRAGLCSFEARYNLPWFMASHADAVVSWQLENELNFAYYDALYGGYPLIHNSDALRTAGVGYHYDGFDAGDGGRTLIAALATHDGRLAEYRRTATSFLETVRATSPANVEAHRRALAALLP